MENFVENFVVDRLAEEAAQLAEYQQYIDSQAQKLDQLNLDILALESVVKAVPVMADLVRNAVKIGEMLRQKQAARSELLHVLGIEE